MNIATVKAKLHKGLKGTFRLLKPRETIEAHDVIVNDTSYDFMAEHEVGLPSEETDTILRLEFESK